MTSDSLDLEAAIRDPAAHFSAPMDVVDDPRLGLDDKRRILASWQRDAELLSTAEAENMPGPERPRLQEVHQASLELERRAAKRR